MKKILLGNEAIVQGALEAGVDFVTGYPGCPSAEIGEGFLRLAKEYGFYAEWSINEKVALESAIGASFSGLKSLVNMKSFGINVCSDSLFPLAYTGTNGPMVIVVADDPSCHSSAQSEQDSRAYAYLSHIPILDACDPQECRDFTKLGFEISEKFNVPVILRTTTRVSHQKAVVQTSEITKNNLQKKAEFIKNPHQFCTMPPRVLEMKNELLEKVKKIEKYFENSKINITENNKKSTKLGIIATGISYLYVKECLEELGLSLPVLKLGSFYPLPSKKIANFIKGVKQVLVIEELDPYLEKEIAIIAKESNPKLKIYGKSHLPETGELNAEKVCSAVAKITGKKFSMTAKKSLVLPKRSPRLCDGCPYWNIFPVIKKVAPENTVFGGDIGCNMIAGLPPHNIQDYLFDMGASSGISHGVAKSLELSWQDNVKQKLISIMGDGTFFHAGIPGLINAVYNKSNFLIIIADNRITAMTGHQQNPGMGKTGMGEDTKEIVIEDVVKACGVENVKTLDPANMQELENTIKDFLTKDGVSVIIAKHICALLERRLKK